MDHSNLQDTPSGVFRFGPFTLDMDRFHILCDGAPVAAEPQTLRLLAHFAANPGRLITRNELAARLWGGRVVSDWAIAAAVKAARAALDDTETPRRYIGTVHGAGFRFLGEVQAQNGDEPSRPVLLVRPFEMLGSDDEQYFADGISEDLITDLSRLKDLQVVSRHAAFATGRTPDPASDNPVGATHLLTGSVRRAQGQIRLNVRLIDAASGTQLWADRLDGTDADIFGLQDEVAARIVAPLRQRLVPLPETRRPSPEAYDHLLRGRAEYYRYAPQFLAKALTHFEADSAADPECAEAFAYQSYCRCTCHVFNWPGSDATLDPALSLAETAIRLDPNSATARLRRGWILGFLSRPEDASREFERALDLAPDSAEAHHNYGETLNRLSRPDAALPLLDKAFRLDRFQPPSWAFARGHSYALLRRTEEALGELDPVLDRLPGFVPALVQRTRVLAEAGRASDAIDCVARLREVAPKYGRATAARMFPYPSAQDRQRLAEALATAGVPD